jgi:hypothetical protein
VPIACGRQRYQCIASRIAQQQQSGTGLCKFKRITAG